MKRLYLCAIISLAAVGAAAAQNPGADKSDQPAAGAGRETGGAAAAARYFRGVILSSNPDGGTLTLNIVDNQRKEREANLRVTASTRYYGADREPVIGGLSFRGFRAGADVWFLTGTGDLTGPITDLRLYMPTDPAEQRPTAGTAGTQPARGQPVERAKAGGKLVVGRVVEFDPDGRTITVRSATGDETKEEVFKVGIDTEFFDPRFQPLPEGLRSPGMKKGVDIWMRVGEGPLATTVRELYLGDPSRKPNNAGGTKPDR